MDYLLFNLLHSQYEKHFNENEIFEENYNKDFENEIESLIEDENKDIISHFKINLINAMDETWTSKCDYLVNLSFLLGMEVQKFLKDNEEY